MRPVTLHDGTVVDSSSEEWRHECEARYILNMPTIHQRRSTLEAIEKKRGEPERLRLQKTIWAMWQLKQNAA